MSSSSSCAQTIKHKFSQFATNQEKILLLLVSRKAESRAERGWPNLALGTAETGLGVVARANFLSRNANVSYTSQREITRQKLKTAKKFCRVSWQERRSDLQTEQLKNYDGEL